ncbi:ORC1-type DNA replication protein [Acidianus hospitalis]|jgi:ORC complex protein Cdc6/Orc1|uniref:ORC1-type DNA replication protein n=1 Tax=Acidianus hospitalis (strain W1) TaxID=933801 RepID=F4B6J9_ACIHW|nr:ORC1-type DNA replication protein [Acidianus hospitalis]AEE93409.1 replication initiator-related protein Cdc6-2 [Acidianus hospitalis W1]MDT7900975.1 ORC1-type DNA replication protein [Acidianus sp.]
MALPSDIINSSLNSPSVLKDGSKLNPDYIPERLPHREDKLKELTIAFRDIVNEPGKSSVRVVITGRTGTGKTVTARIFGKAFAEQVKNRGIKVEYVHVNCHRERTLYLITLKIAEQLKLSIPPRGLSSQEVFKIIHEYLERRNMYVIITLDEFDYFLNSSPPEDIYFIVRLYDELAVNVKRVSYIFIIRDLTTLSSLDKTVRDHIARDIIEFPPYKSNELYDILQDRVKIAFYDGTVSDDAVKFISDINGFDKGGSGNARLSIETLELAGRIADAEGSPIVTVEHAKKANSRLNEEASIILDELNYLELHPMLLVKALINLSKREKKESFPIGEVEDEYSRLCELLGVEPRRHTQVFEYMRRLKLMGIINTQQSGKGMRGRTTLLSLTFPASQELDDYVTKLIGALKNSEQK